MTPLRLFAVMMLVAATGSSTLARQAKPAAQTAPAAQAPLNIRLATAAPVNSSWHKALLDMGAELTAKTSNRVRLTVYAGGTQGDEPATSANEAFDPLLLSFHDWGTWWQGEIAGGYFLRNSNLISHQVRAHVQPHDAISGGDVKLTGDQAKLTEVVSYLDTFPFWFNIVTP